MWFHIEVSKNDEGNSKSTALTVNFRNYVRSVLHVLAVSTVKTIDRKDGNIPKITYVDIDGTRSGGVSVNSNVAHRDGLKP